MFYHDADDVDDRNSQSHHSHNSPFSQDPASPTTTNDSVTRIGTDEKVDSTGAVVEPMGSAISKERPASGSHDEKAPRRTSDEALGDSTQIHGHDAVVSGANSGDHAATAAAAMAAEYKVYKRRWIGLWSLTLLNIIVSWDWLTFSPVSQDAAVYYSTNEGVINWLSTAFLFAFVVICPVTVYILHYGPKPSIITAAVLILVGNWIRYAGSHSKDGGIFGVVMLGQIFTGLAQPFVLSAPTRYSDLWFTNRGRVAATALMSLANPFGAALGELIVPFMVARPSDVSNMVLYVAIISSVCCLPAFFIPREPPTPPAPSCETPKEDLRFSARKLWGSVEFWLVAFPFGLYVGFFNSISSLINQMMMPYGFTSQDAGIAGAILIVVGLVTAAIVSPILDRTKAFLLAIKILVPILGIMYLVFIWMPQTRNDAGPYIILAVIGAASFTLLPVALEYLIEISHPTSPEVTSTIAWASGQLLGGCFILISNALKAGPDANPPNNMNNALIFEAVVSLACVPLPLCLGLFGRKDKVVMRRVQSDDEAFRPSGETSETAISSPV